MTLSLQGSPSLARFPQTTSPERGGYPRAMERRVPSLDTLLAHAGAGDASKAPLAPSIHPATTYRRGVDGTPIDGRTYARDESPAYIDLEALLAQLEGGAAALVYGSGMAACAGVFAALRPGDHLLVPGNGYWGVRAWIDDVGRPWGLDVDEVDMTDAAAVARVLRPGVTKLVFAETPLNPGLEIVDLAALADLTHRAGALLAVDSTLATPLLTRPIEIGADIVVHSATKYLNGHSDVLAGAVVLAREDEFADRIRRARLRSGPMLGAFEAWLVLRGCRTLAVRVRRQCESAARLAAALEGHPRLARVRYPGLASHPGHDVAARQMQGGFGAMVSIEVVGGAAAALAVASRLQVFARATSLGGTESLVEHRASVEGAGTRVPPGLLRLSIGLEDAAELLADLLLALDAP